MCKAEFVMKLRQIVVLCRPQQWLKNLFIFLPLFFNGNLFEFVPFFVEIVVFAAFSLAASSVYCFNDIFDAEVDRLHPSKKYRPIAAGLVSKGEAYVLIVILLSLSIGVLSLARSLISQLNGELLNCFVILFLYLFLNFCYSLFLKRYPLIDVFVISFGFLLRIAIGALSTNAVLSHWIVLMTFLLALFLAFAKRRDDVVNYEINKVVVRKNIHRYNLDFMNQVIAVIASITVVCYIMYTVSPEVIDRLGAQYLYLTSIFVIAGIIRYLQITIVDVKSGSPTKVLLSDRFIQCSVFLWIMSYLGIIYA